jgi:hypothetical protein
LFGTEEKAKVIYPLREQLGLFFLGGKIAARRGKLRERIEAMEVEAEALTCETPATLSGAGVSNTFPTGIAVGANTTAKNSRATILRVRRHGARGIINRTCRQDEESSTMELKVCRIEVHWRRGFA